MSDKADKVLNEINVFLDEKVQKELRQVIEYLSRTKRGLSYNDPEKRQINFHMRFWELLLRTGVTLNTDPDPGEPHLKGPNEGMAEVIAFMEKEGHRASIETIRQASTATLQEGVKSG
jgi:hypothetical protein